MFPPQPTGTTSTESATATNDELINTNDTPLEEPVNVPTAATENIADEEEDMNITVNEKPAIDVPDSELIRQRRLQRFNSLPVSVTLSSVAEKETEENEREDHKTD